MRQKTVLISGIPSDSHTWNLVFMQLVMEERGYKVINLGPCVRIDDIINECLYQMPEILLISTINGHGYIDGYNIIKEIRAIDCLSNMRVVIGGKLGITRERKDKPKEGLLKAGYDGVFDGSNQLENFFDYLNVYENCLPKHSEDESRVAVTNCFLEPIGFLQQRLSGS